MLLVSDQEDTDLAARPFTSASSSNQAWKVPPAETAATASPARPQELRAVMRLLPHSVVVCTASSPYGLVPAPRGMTMSSFTSLSLGPPAPLVTLNMATPSRTLDAVAQSRLLNVHVLRGGAEGARVAEWFRRGNASGLGVFGADGMRQGCGCAVVAGGDGEAPPLLEGEGVLYALRCRLLDDEPHRGLVEVRDHVVVLAEVVDIVEGTGRAATGEQDEVFGLAYADRRYRQLGGSIVNEEEG